MPMKWWRRKGKGRRRRSGARGEEVRPFVSPVLAVDGLGFNARIDACRDAESLGRLALELDAQFHGFRSKIPFEVMRVGPDEVLGSDEFSTVRFNDMFILFSESPRDNLPLRYLVAASLAYHQLLANGFIVRGGLGFGPVVHHRDLFLGRGFLDAYRMAESRAGPVRDVCAIMVSPSFFWEVSWSRQCCRVICLYEDHYFVHPNFLVDPEMGEFDNDRILRCLKDAGADAKKMTETKRFLERFEDYDTAMLPGSRSRELTGWTPERGAEARKHVGPSRPLEWFDDWPSVHREVARQLGTIYEPPERGSIGSGAGGDRGKRQD